MAKSMTEGKTLKLIFQFAVPLLIGNLLQQTYNIIDAAIVGRILGADALAGVGASSSVQFLVLGFCIGICSGFGIPVSQSFGAGNMGEMQGYIFNGGVLTAAIAAVMTAGSALLCHGILFALAVPEEIYDNAYQYLLVIFLGIPFTLLYNYLSSTLRAIGDSKTPFVFLAFSTGLNIILDLFCIVALKWGCMGAAVATVAAQAVSGILCLGFIKRKVSILHLESENCRLGYETVKDLVVMGFPMGLQYSITAIGSMVMQAANNGLGSIYVSGFTAAVRIKQFTKCPFDAIASAISVFCSQNLGAKRIDRIRRGIWEGVLIVLFFGLAIGLVLIFGGRTLSMMFISRESAQVLDASAKYLRCMGYFYWAMGTLCVCRMSIQGLGYAGRGVLSGVMEMVARIFVSMTFVGRFGYTAVCYTDQAAWIAACIYIVPTCIWCVKQLSGKAAEAAV